VTAATRSRDARPLGKSLLGRQMRRWSARWAFTFLGLLFLSAFLVPLAFMASTALKDGSQVSDASAPLWPATPRTFTWQGAELPVFDVPTADGTRQWALVEPHREDAVFIDPAHPDAGLITWQGRWRTLHQAWQLSFRLDNFATVWNTVNFGRLLLNTFGIAILSTIGTLISSVCVAYGFSRFRIPGKNGLFLLLLATIILPFQVTLLPQYILFTWLGWNGTWLPLIIPHCFANAYNVFLLRQYFLSIPRELDEAAMIDGAGPFRVLRSVIAPQSVAAITAVALFHFFFAWNDFFVPYLYLASKPELQPLSIAIQQYNALYASQPTLIQASALMTMAVPVIVFLLAQRAFMRGVVVTGVEK
jgi:multiple sugar transport system permease protein